MNNSYAVILKWSKKYANSPGYIDGFTIDKILKSDNLQESLENYKISPLNFNEKIYFNWADISFKIANLGIVYAFTYAKSSDDMIYYSVSIYESEDSYNSARNNNLDLFKKLEEYREDYAELMGLTFEKKAFNLTLSDEDLLKILLNEFEFNKINNLFNNF